MSCSPWTEVWTSTSWRRRLAPPWSASTAPLGSTYLGAGSATLNRRQKTKDIRQFERYPTSQVPPCETDLWPVAGDEQPLQPWPWCPHHVPHGRWTLILLTLSFIPWFSNSIHIQFSECSRRPPWSSLEKTTSRKLPSSICAEREGMFKCIIENLFLGNFAVINSAGV